MGTNIFCEGPSTETKVEAIFLGSGSAFCLDNWHSNVLLTVEDADGKKSSLLIDCGGDVRHSLRANNLSHLDVDGVYLSHPHADHIGGVEYIAFASRFDPAYIGKPTLIGNWKVLDTSWEHAFKAGLSSLEGEEATLNTYFEVKKISDNNGFVFNGLEIELIRMIHTMDNQELMPAYGLMIKMNGKTAFFTTDAQHAPKQIQCFYDQADIIFHDCETLYAKGDDGQPDIEKPFMSGVHAHLEELKDLPAETRAKMFLYHYQDGSVGTAIDVRRKAFGFREFVMPGQKFVWPN